MDFNAFVVPGLLLLAMTAMVAGLALYRFFVSREQEFHLHATTEEMQMAGNQVAVAKKLEKVDRWGKLLTTLTVAYGVVLAALFLYMQFQKTGTPNY